MAEAKENLGTETRNEILETRTEQKPEVITGTERRHKVEVMTDVRETTPRVPHEVKSWMQKIEEDPGQMKTVHDDSGQPVLVPTPNQNPKVVLPVTRARFVEGFKKTVNEAGRWLSGFLLKLIKKRKGNVKFKQE
ncbi:hypothetical protein HYV64_00620 [Candidatus Shapirobacteria bacterium]|nr:hypothetical protein [Candidatus Shapirobacteria bacterium]